jgi:hypothetical protein
LAAELEALTPTLASIPVVDARDGAALRLAQEDPTRARALHAAIMAWSPHRMRPLVPMLDGVARWWLVRSQSPYVDEVGALTELLGLRGIWLLNGSYQWACTALAREEDDGLWLVRTLDWEFPGLGRFVCIARMSGSAGEYYSVTWPGYAGVLTALAPARFAAAMNQAPLRRRTVDPRLRPFDMAVNLSITLRHSRAIPPDHLLRRVFEIAEDYAQAKRILEVTPVARPVIYTLAGCRSGERCIIERTEEGARTRSGDHGVANDWLDPSPGWEGRIEGARILTCTFEDAAENSRMRREALARWRGAFAQDSFGWVAPPILNSCTRLAVETCPVRGILRVVGYERPIAGGVAERATAPCSLSVEATTA